MSRRPSLPGAAELFRVTGSAAGPEESGTARPQAPPRPAPHAIDNTVWVLPDRQPAEPQPGAPRPAERQPGERTRIRAVGERRSSGRERHDEKITVYCSPEELVDLERARLALRTEHGLVVDRGRIVREAIAVVLADLEAKGDGSIIVRRLQER
ncbi:MAG: hypothetical protein HY241_13225 [Actinobacteria bacterium]|nr:hypothetical protein [Actinomycetota bacterium]